MIVLTEKDYLEVKLNSLIADYDKDTLVNLYQPIIGFEAFAVYLTLWGEANNQKISSMISHGQLFNQMKITTKKFVDSRRTLEAAGLVKTYITDAGNSNIYRYELFAPKAPWDFFGNALLYGMLIKAIGEADALRIKAIYKIDLNEEKGKEISSSFMEVFHPDFNDPAFVKALSNTGDVMGRRVGKITSDFSYEKFFDSLSKISQIKPEAFSKKDMKEIERLATLNGINEETAANDVCAIYDSEAGKGHHVDFEKLGKLFQDETNYNYLASKKKAGSGNTISSSSELAGKINIIETVSPKDFLSILQNGCKPATADLKIINDLSINYRLSNAVINVLIEYVLLKNNNVLSRAYAEKVAASLARECVETAVDAMNFLNKINKKTRSININQEQTLQKEVTENKKEEKDELDWDKLLSELDEVNGNGEIKD